MIKDLSREEFLVKVAEMYYIQGQSQQDIAGQLNTSRSNIARYLKMCVEMGIIEFKIKNISSTSTKNRDFLEQRYGLKKAIFVPSIGAPEQIKADVGAAAADYLDSIVQDGLLIGLSWGTTVYQMVCNYRPKQRMKADIIQFVGGIGSKSIDTDGHEVAKQLQKHFEGSSYLLHAPMVLQNSELCQMLLEQNDIKNHFQMMAKTDIAVVGIGHNGHLNSAGYRSGYVTKKDADEMIKKGAIGDICGTPIDIHGAVCDTSLTGRVLAISLDSLKQIPIRLGVACGPQKTEPILGALRGGHVNAIVLDEDTANRVIELSE